MAERKYLTVSARLARFGLADLENQLQDLKVQGGQEVHIDPQDRAHAKRIAVLDVRSADDLKRWLGVPDGAIGQASPATAHPVGFVSTDIASPFLDILPAIPLKDPELRARLMLYVTSSATAAKQTPTEKKLRAQLDTVTSNAGIKLAVFLNANIYVEAGATLVIGKKITHLFANQIILEDGATIRMDGSFTQIDCASISKKMILVAQPA
jgi:hypothetical protein